MYGSQEGKTQNGTIKLFEGEMGGTLILEETAEVTPAVDDTHPIIPVMFSKGIKVKPNVDYTVDVTFFDGSVKKYDLNEFIEARIGKLGPHVKISSSNLILAIVANLINSASEPAYATPEFYSNRPTWSYFAVSSDDINRHVIGRLLDKIYEYGVEKFFIELASHVMKKMGISPESIHADSTSFHYHGEWLCLII